MEANSAEGLKISIAHILDILPTLYDLPNTRKLRFDTTEYNTEHAQKTQKRQRTGVCLKVNNTLS